MFQTETKSQYHMPIASLPDMIKYTGERPKTNEIYHDFLGHFNTSRRLQKLFQNAIYHAYTLKNSDKRSVDEYIPISRTEAKRLAQTVTEGERLETLSNGLRRVKSPAPRKRGSKPTQEEASISDDDDDDDDDESDDASTESESESESEPESEEDDDLPRQPRRKRQSRK
jgi:hypothetical protein